MHNVLLAGQCIQFTKYNKTWSVLTMLRTYFSKLNAFLKNALLETDLHYSLSLLNPTIFRITLHHSSAIHCITSLLEEICILFLCNVITDSINFSNYFALLHYSILMQLVDHYITSLLKLMSEYLHYSPTDHRKLHPYTILKTCNACSYLQKYDKIANSRLLLFV